MAMQLEKSGINLSHLLSTNNIFLNGIMERMERKYICKYKLKGIGGLKKLIKLKKYINSIKGLIKEYLKAFQGFF